MNNKHYVGKQISSFERYDDITITGVALLVDDENEYLAGNDSGYLLEISCPYGTQTMANNLLASLQGKTYRGFRAENTALSPAAELGDGVVVNGVYSLLAYRNVEFGPGHMAEIAAPGEGTLEHEYKWESPEKREYNRKIAETRSLIAKTSEEILLKIEGEGGLEGQVSSLTQTLTSIVLEIRGSGDEDGLSDRVSLIEQTLDNITLSVSNGETSSTIKLMSGSTEIDSAEIKLTGVVTFAGLKDGTTTIDGGCIKTGTIDADRLNLTGQITFGDLDEELQSDIENAGGISEQQAKTLITDTLVSSPTIKGGLFYDLESIGRLDLSLEAYGDSLPSLLFTDTRNNVDLFAVYPLNVYSTWAGLTMLNSPVLSVEKWEGEDENHMLLYGTWNFRPAELVDFSEANVDFGGQSADDLGITFDVPEPDLSDISLSSIDGGDGSSLYIAKDDYFGSWHIFANRAIVPSDDSLAPNVGTWRLPWASGTFTELYVNGAEVTSDRNEKHDIFYDLSGYDALFDALRPVGYKLNSGTSGRVHIGMIAQDVEETVALCGMTGQDFGAVVRLVEEDGAEHYYLRYMEFIGLLIDQVQKLKARVASLEEA